MPIVCPECGERNTDDAKMCGMCGDLLPERQQVVLPPPPPSPAHMQRSSTPQSLAIAADVIPSLSTARHPQRTSTPQDADGEHADVWLRIAAMAIDDFVMSIVMLPLGVLVFLVALCTPSSDRLAHANAVMAVFTLVMVVVNCLYRAFMESSSLQGTLGKLVVGIKVTDMQRNRLGFVRACVRYIFSGGIGIVASTILIFYQDMWIGKWDGSIIFFIGLAYSMVGYATAAVSEQRQGLHDMLAGALVIKKYS